MPDDENEILQELNPEQREAVTHGAGPLLILAGAGSGKTRALTHRIAYLISTGVAGPENILAITFTNKAAGEMRRRISAMLGEEAAEGMWMGTFHSVCARILRLEATRLGYRRGFTVYDADDSERLVKQCMAELEIDPKKRQPRALRDAISRMKDELIDPDTFAADAAGPGEQELLEVYRLYQSRLTAANSMDFGDLIMNVVALFELFQPVLEAWSRRFRYILVDEYQDTNRAQYRLIRLLSKGHGNLSVVGDDDQSIYGWRGADIKNILDFEADFTKTKVVKLERNYRSTAVILEAANAVISRNTGRKPKALWTEIDGGEPIEVYGAADEFAEAAYIIRTIEALERRGEPLSGIAVFYRTHAQSRVLEEGLIKSGILYRIVGGPRFYERAEIKDAVAYLRLIENPDDDISARRIVNVPTRGLGKGAVEKLGDYARLKKISFSRAWELADSVPGLSPKAKKAATGLAAVLEGWREGSGGALLQLIERVLGDSGYIEGLRASDSFESTGRIENLEEFMVSAAEFEGRYPDAGLSGFLEQVSLVADVDKLEKAAETVTLLTLHNAKGLEFADVFISGMEEGLFPHPRSVREGDIEEERRLCYVGITRARKRLYLTYASSRMMYGGRTFNVASRFLSELPSGDVEREAELPTPASTPQSFQPGDIVDHPKLGRGTVVGSQSAKVISVLFQDGKPRQLHLDYAPLELVSRG